MGDHADDIIFGLMCEVCGMLIDGQEPGHPRTCNKCNQEFKKDLLITKAEKVEEYLLKSGFKIKEKVVICAGSGIQFKLSQQSIVCVYNTGKTVVQGKYHQGLEKQFKNKRV